MGDSDDREKFLRDVRHALGRPEGVGSDRKIRDAAYLSHDAVQLEERVCSVRAVVQQNADELISELEVSAIQIGWTVVRVESLEAVSRYVVELAQEMKVRSVLRSVQPVVDRLRLEDWFSSTDIELRVMAIDEMSEESPDIQRRSLRERVVRADMGVTGVDYAIAETGSCVLLAKKGLSRLVSLAPSVHVAVVERGQVLPSLDELFTLRRHDFLHGKGGSYMNIISGPSRSADIEQTIVKGVHGPSEAHMVLLG